MQPHVTFAPPAGTDVDVDTVLAELAVAGFEAGPPEWVHRTVLDTFDGLLHAAGLRLELREDDGAELVLRGAGAAAAHLAVDTVPSLIGDLPAGPFRSRLAPVIGIRALLGQLTFTAMRTVAIRRDADGKALVVATVFEEPTGDDLGDDQPAFTVEVEELTGYAKAARRTQALLGTLGLERCDGDTADVLAAGAGLDLAGFRGSPTIALDAGAPAIESYRRVLINLLDTVEANVEGTVEALDPEFLHDLRVAVRRSRSVVSEGKRVLPSDIRRRFGAELKWLAGETSEARDLDVYVIEWDGYVAPLGDAAPALAPVRDHLDAQRRTAHAALARQLRSRRTTALLKQWRAWLEAAEPVGEPGRHAGRRTDEVVAERITAAHDHLVEQGRMIDADSPGERLHDLRKDAKKLRYLLECFGGLYEGKARKAFVQRLKALQDNLGEHQDAEVHTTQLHAVAEEIHGTPAGGAETLLAMGRLTAHLEQRRLAMRAEFAERFADFDTAATREKLADLLGSARSWS